MRGTRNAHGTEVFTKLEAAPILSLVNGHEIHAASLGTVCQTESGFALRLAMGRQALFVIPPTMQYWSILGVLFQTWDPQFFRGRGG